MAEARFRIAFAGPHVAVQDGGRPGLMRFGVTRSGPMDRLAHAAANRALGRPADAPAVEVSLGGLTLDCLEGAVTVAVAGGGFVVAHDGRRHGSWVVLRLAAGERLQIRPGHWGSWCYLAFAGTLAHATWLGSAATHTMSGRGGGLLSTGGELVVSDPDPAAAPHGPLRCPVFARPLARAAVVPGPQDHEFLPDALPTLLGAEWRVSSAYDRMGMRLEGPPLALGDALSIPSQAIVAGSLLGTSSTTAYVESASGVQAGGRTGLTALTVAVLFLAALFFAPLAGSVPAFATAPALLFVACLMMRELVDVAWDDITEAAPAALTAVTMPFTYSIANGLAFGFISYAVIKLLTGRASQVHAATWIVAALFVIKFAFFGGH